MNEPTRAMRAPLLAVLLILSLFAGPLHYAFAEELPAAEPVVEEPVIEPQTAINPIKPVVDPIIEPVIEPLVEPVLDIIPTEPVVTEPEMLSISIEPSISAMELGSSTEETASTTEATTTPSYLSITAAITLPDGCVIEDTDGTMHIFPTASTTEYLAACAIAEAAETDALGSFEAQNFPYGLFVTAIEGVAAADDEYWALWHNGAFASCGIACLSLSAGDTVSFVRTTFAGDEKDRITIEITALEDRYDNILVPDACAAIDTASTTHTFPAGETLLGICALVAAQDAGIMSGFELTNASFGLYVSGLDDSVLAADEYWALWLNGAYASCGVTCLPVEIGDTLSFVRTTFAEVESDRFDLRVIGSVEVPTEPETGTGGSGETPEEPADTFDVDAAYAFLASLESGGSVENELVTDWAAIAYAVSGAPRSTRSAIASHLKTEEFDLSTAADYERHAMALMALNINPYTGGPEDYITPIVNAFDGEQIGDDRYINDDIFALFPLLHAGYTKSDQLIKDITAYVVDGQSGNGSWENSVDMTAAAIQALKPLSSLPGVSSALGDAESYLQEEQEADGGFGNAFATAWAVQAIEALGDSPNSWTVGDNTPLTYLAELQEEDGGLDVTPDDDWNRAWATAYAVPAVQGATWHDLLEDFAKPATGSPATSNEEDEEVVEEVVIEEIEETIIPSDVPLAPAFTYEAPLETKRVVARTTPTIEETATEEEVVAEETEVAQTLTASAASAEGGSWLMGMLGSLWEGIASFFRGIFS